MKLKIFVDKKIKINLVQRNCRYQFLFLKMCNCSVIALLFGKLKHYLLGAIFFIIVFKVRLYVIPLMTDPTDLTRKNMNLEFDWLSIFYNFGYYFCKKLSSCSILFFKRNDLYNYNINTITIFF